MSIRHGPPKLHRIRLVILALALACAATPFSVSPIFASCAPPRSPHDNTARYVITSGSPAGVDGLQASISEYDPYYTGYNATGTNMTLMLLSARSTNQWAQWGWFKSKIHTGSVTRESGYEIFVDASHNLWQFFGGMPVGSYTTYKVIYSPATTYYYFYRNGSFIDMQQRNFVPNNYQIFGETHDKMDQMPGGSSSRAQFLSTQYSANGTWHTVSSAISPDPLFGGTHPSAGRYDIWDNSCTF